MTTNEKLMPKKQFYAALTAARTQRHSGAHPFSEAWARGELTREQLGFWAIQHHYYIELIPQQFAHLYCKLPDLDARQHMLENLLGEEVPDQPGKRRGLLEVQFRSRLPKINLARRLDPIGSRAEVDAVHIGLEDFLFGQLGFDAECQSGFNDLAVEIFSTERETVSGKLLGERAGALAEVAEHEVAHDCASDADRIDAVVAVKPRVLTTDEGVDEMVRDFVERHDLTILASEA